MTDTAAIRQNREYMTDLLKRRSVIALCCGFLTLVLAFYGIIASVIRSVSVFGSNGFVSFIYYTMVSNTVAAVSISFVIPFAVEGIRKKRFVLPRWAAVMHFLAAVSIAIMFVFVLSFISWASPEEAFSGTQIIMHVFCPVLILISFFQTENGYIYQPKDWAVGCIPFYIYIVIYFIEVVLVGRSNGGWPDLYHIREYLHPAAAVPLLLLFGLAVSASVALLSNHLTRKRKEKLFRYWQADADPVEVRIEAYGLGRMTGLNGEKNSIQIPLDILVYLAERYRLGTEDLTKPFMKGLLNGLKERESRQTFV